MNAHALLEHIAEQAADFGVLDERKKGAERRAFAKGQGSFGAGKTRKARKQARKQAKSSAKRQARRERARSKGKGEGTPGGSKATRAKPLKSGHTLATPGARVKHSNSDASIFARSVPLKRKQGVRGFYPVDPSRGRASAMGSLRAASAKRGGDGRFRDGGSETPTYKAVLDRVKGAADALAMHRKDDNYRGFRDVGSGLSAGGREVTKGSPIPVKPKSKGSKKRTGASSSTRGGRSRGRTAKAIFTRRTTG